MTRGSFGILSASCFTGSMFGQPPLVFAVMCYAVANAKPSDHPELGVVGRLELHPTLLAGTFGVKPPEVTEAINDLPQLHDRKSFSWVSYPDGGFETLADAIDQWRFETEYNENETALVITYFVGEKLGDDEVFFHAIAPFVKSGAVVECYGEDHAAWRYLFEDGKCIEQQGKVVWE